MNAFVQSLETALVRSLLYVVCKFMILLILRMQVVQKKRRKLSLVET
jgi:hypothetical protein